MSTADSTLLSIDTRAAQEGLINTANPKTADFLELFQAVHVQGQNIAGTYGILTALVTPSRAPGAWQPKLSKIRHRVSEALVQFDEWVTEREAKVAKERKAQERKAAKRTKDRERRLDLAVSALERVASKGTGEPVVEAARTLLRDVL